MKKTLEWNLICQSGELLLCDEIEKTDTCELQYPMEVETQARQAIIRADKEQFVRCWKLFTEACLEKNTDRKVSGKPVSDMRMLSFIQQKNVVYLQERAYRCRRYCRPLWNP